MIVLKSIAAVYVSLYLILPACMCQLLGAFGYDIHGPSTAAVSAPLPTISAEVVYAAPVCHCEDHIDKTAEPDCSETAGVDHFDLLFTIVDAASVKEIARGTSGAYGSRAPPGTPVWSHSSHSGVYRI